MYGRLLLRNYIMNPNIKLVFCRSHSVTLFVVDHIIFVWLCACGRICSRWVIYLHLQAVLIYMYTYVTLLKGSMWYTVFVSYYISTWHVFKCSFDVQNMTRTILLYAALLWD